jgi:hypothetical protein
LAASVAIDSCRLTLSWFITHQCGYRRLLRNPALKVAGFDRSLTTLLTSVSRPSFPKKMGIGKATGNKAEIRLI